jgi:hypothetical protein
VTYSTPQLLLVGAAKGLVLGSDLDQRPFRDPSEQATYRDKL